METNKLAIARIREISGIFAYNTKERIMLLIKTALASARGRKMYSRVASLASPHGIWLKSGMYGGRLEYESPRKAKAIHRRAKQEVKLINRILSLVNSLAYVFIDNSLIDGKTIYVVVQRVWERILWRDKYHISRLHSLEG